MTDYDHMQKVLQDNEKRNKEAIGEKAIDFAIKILKEESRNFKGDYSIESWYYNNFHPDIESLHIKWKRPLMDKYERVMADKYQLKKEKQITENLLDKVSKFITANHQLNFPTNEWVEDFNPEIESINIRWKKKQYSGDHELTETNINNDDSHEKPKFSKYKVDKNGVKSYVGEFTLHEIVNNMCESSKENKQQESKSIEDLLKDLKFLDDKPLQLRAYVIYGRFLEVGIHFTMANCLTRSFMKYFYENDSWRVRMNDVWGEWEYYLTNEDDIEKVKSALEMMGMERDE